MALSFPTNPRAMRLAVVLAGAGTEGETDHLNLRELRAAFADLSEKERFAGEFAERAGRAERFAQMGATA